MFPRRTLLRVIISPFKVNAVIYFRPVDPIKAVTEVEDFYYATSQIAQTTLRSILGQSQLDDLLTNREQLNAELQKVIDTQTEPWGVKVSAVVVKNVDLPTEMLRAIARQAEAERERRAKIIHAEGEFSGIAVTCRCCQNHCYRACNPAAPFSANTDGDCH